ncbi:MAG: hypothetical protein QM610_02020 [Chitinophagaceae bacterium]
MKVYSIFCLCICVIFAPNCRRKIIDNSALYQGSVEIKFTGNESGYKWNFNRYYNNTLSIDTILNVKSKDITYLCALNDSILGGLDYKNGKLFFFSNNFKYLFSFNAIKEVMGYQYDNNRLYIYDFTNRTLKKFEPNVFRNSFDLKASFIIPDNSAVYRANQINDSLYIYAHPNKFTNDLDFIVCTSNSEVSRKGIVKEFLKIKNIKHPELSLDGEFITASGSPFIVYACSFAGLFIVIDKNKGFIKYLSKTIDQTPIPKPSFVKISPNISHLEISPSIQFFPSASVRESTLFILNFINKNHDATVDLYNLSAGGKYMKSIYIPPLVSDDFPVSIAIQNNFLFALYKNDKIVKYKINEKE